MPTPAAEMRYLYLPLRVEGLGFRHTLTPDKVNEYGGDDTQRIPT